MENLIPFTAGRNILLVFTDCVLTSFLFQITKLKIDNNPFAKGFRENGAGQKRRNQEKRYLLACSPMTATKTWIKQRFSAPFLQESQSFRNTREKWN